MRETCGDSKWPRGHSVGERAGIVQPWLHGRAYTASVTTIHDVAKLAGVSATTAKRALRSPELLRPATLTRVREAVAQLHYEPDLTAGALRKGKGQVVGLIVGSIVEPFFAELARSVSRALHAEGYSVLLSENEYRSDLELEALRLLHGQRAGALIVRSGYGPSNLEYLCRLQERGVFVLEIDHHLPDSPFGWVMLDNAACVREGVRYLHALGHTRIAALGTYDQGRHPEERSRTFPQAMGELGLSVPPEYRRVIQLNEQDAYTLTRDLMRLPEPPTALFALTGTGASGAFKALRELGVRLPQDVSLLAFDDYPWMSLVNPSIDTFAQPVRQMGEAAANLVLRAMRGDPPKTVRLTLPGTLLRRGSCAPPRKIYRHSASSAL